MMQLSTFSFSVLVVISVVANSLNLPNKAATPNEVQTQQAISWEREMSNRLLNRLMDVAYETFQDLGGSEHELQEIKRKRGRITQCFFQAVTCF